MKSPINLFSNKICIVTGAGSGIGLELTRCLLANRAIVWALDQDGTALDLIAKESHQNGQTLFTSIVDLTHSSEVSQLIRDIRSKSRKMHLWINNAGVQKIGAFSDLSSAEFEHVMNINFNAVVNITRQLLPIMEQQGDGIILNMASVAGLVPAPFMASYVASKHAVIGFSRALCAELSLLNSPIRCAVASPGFVDTDIIKKGAPNGFPIWLSWLLANPKDCATEILTQLARGSNDIEPTLNGRAVTRAFKLMPKITVHSSRILLTESFKDFVRNRYKLPR